MNKAWYIFIVLLNFLTLGIKITVADCLSSQVEIIDQKNSSLVGCGSAVISLKSDPVEEEKYLSNVNEKMAKLVAIQTKQIMQELGASSSYYEKNNESLLAGESSAMRNSCKFDFIQDLESKGCNGRKSSAEEKNKLRMITDALSEDFKSNSLMDSLVHIYGKNKYGDGFENSKPGQCPLSGSAYPLTSQLTNETAKLIIDKFQKTDNSFAVDQMYQAHLYPQLDMIQEAEKITPGFKAKFEEYVKAFDPKKNEPQKYFSEFFYQEKNKQIIGKGVAGRCEQVRSSISTFVCHPLNQAASLDPKISKKLFNDYDPRKDFSEQKSSVRESPEAFKTYAFLCLAKKDEKRKPKPEVNCLKMLPEDDSVDNWYKCFKEGVQLVDTERDKENIKNFCENYNCKSPAALKTKSCMNGGPLASQDLAALHLKNELAQNEISFLEMLERNSANRFNYKMSGNSSLSPSDPGYNDEWPSTLKKNLSDFDLNAFGASAVMKFAGIKETPKTILIVKEEMKNKGIAPSSKEEIRRVVSRGEAPQVIPSSINEIPSFAPIASEVNQFNKPSSTETIYKKTRNTIVATNDFPVNSNTSMPGAQKKKTEEESQMLKDLEQLMKDQKIENEKNLKQVSSPIAAEKLDSQNKNSPFESWAQSLRNKEAILNERENFANIREADFWRRENELRARENFRPSDSFSKGKVETLKIASNDNKNILLESNNENTPRVALKLKQELAQGINATSSGLVVTPEKLDKLEKADLKNFGVNIDEPFLISIRMNEKLIHVRVAQVVVKGKRFLAPRLNENNEEVKEAILKSPIFKEFRYFYEKENLSYFPSIK